MKTSIAFLFAFGLAGSSLANWTVRFLHPMGVRHSEIFDSSRSSQVGYVVQDYRHAGFWQSTSSSFVDLHPNGFFDSFAFGASKTQQVGQVMGPRGALASLWSGTSTSWVNLNPEGIYSAKAVGTDGFTQVGVVDSGGSTKAALWKGTAASFKFLHPYGAVLSSGSSVSGNIQTGHVIFPTGAQAGYWQGSADSWVRLRHSHNDEESSSYRTDGKSIVGWARVNQETKASLWDIGTGDWVDLSPIDSNFSSALDVEGQYQVGFANCGNADSAFFWTRTAQSAVNLGEFLPSRFEGSCATSISVTAGEIVVSGTAFAAPGFSTEALQWVHPVPEPGTIAAALAGVAFFALHRYRKNS